jgi:hypothetical protein
MQEIYYIFIVIISELRVIVSGTISIFIQIDVFVLGGTLLTMSATAREKNQDYFLL